MKSSWQKRGGKGINHYSKPMYHRHGTAAMSSESDISSLWHPKEGLLYQGFQVFMSLECCPCPLGCWNSTKPWSASGGILLQLCWNLHRFADGDSCHKSWNAGGNDAISLLESNLIGVLFVPSWNDNLHVPCASVCFFGRIVNTFLGT